MRKFLILTCLILSLNIQAQNTALQSNLNIRGSFLLFPFTPLLTVEFRTVDKFTIQLETNFVDTHGFNLKYFWKERMNKDFVFVGMALLNNSLLREDENLTYLPYAGYGYAKRFGKSQNWTWDSRFGLGFTSNADNNFVYPVLKTGLGRVF